VSATRSLRTAILHGSRALVIAVDERHTFGHSGLDRHHRLQDGLDGVRLPAPARIDVEDLTHTFIGRGRAYDEPVDILALQARVFEGMLKSERSIAVGIVRLLAIPHTFVVADPVRVAHA